MAKLKEILVKVKGSGQFPIDMLRHDNLVPHTEEDAGMIDRAMRTIGNQNVITLKGWWHGADKYPSRLAHARWESFGWHIIEVSLEGKCIG